jgi:hypothetical protein
MERKEALEIILAAAQNWYDELVNYIIPNAEETEGDDAEGYRNSADSIASAIAQLRTTIDNT